MWGIFKHMRPIGIITDSHSSITQEEAKKLGIWVLPMPFYIDGECYLEGVNLTREEFFAKLESGSAITTSQPSPADVCDVWDWALKEFEKVLYMPLSSGLSGSCETAMALARDEEYEGRVLVVDHGQIATPLHQLILDTLELIEKVAEEAAKANSKLDSLEVKLPSGSVVLDAETLQTITEEAECNMIRLVLDKVGEKRLNEKQKDALDGKTVYGGYEAYLYCVKGQKRISDFEGGEATLSVPFKVPAGKSAENFSVWYISDSGNLTRLPTWFDGKNICWSVGHFSDFVILYNANVTVKVNPNTGAGEHFFACR